MEDTGNDNDTEEAAHPAQGLCTREVTALFPDVCPQFLQSIAAPLQFSPQAVINHILDLIESGQTYKKREQPQKDTTKRKRDTDEQDDELEETVRNAKRMYTSDNRVPRYQPGQKDSPLVRYMIAGDFPYVPLRIVQQFLSENNRLLFPTYLAINEAIQQHNEPLPWTYKKTPTVQSPQYGEASIDETIRSANASSEREQDEVALMEELKAARLARRHSNLMREKELEALEVEKRNFDEAKSRGEIKECECCFVDTAENRLVHCNGEDTHFFCIQCARRHAETQVGLSKHELECLSTEGCEAGFSRTERQKFLTESLASALDRIEQDENLRLAGLPNLAQCPFCSYAEEYPPVDIDKEFRCRKSECMTISCRLCNSQSHVPKTCKEAATERGLDVRRELEEAMSKALIRRCNKCQTPFVKESGCNKMTCSKSGCSNIQCYVCSKSCDYTHFNDRGLGGKSGNCPLFEDSEKRHMDEVKAAEENTKQKVLEENPHLEPELLDFRTSSKVKKDDARRLEKSAARNEAYNGRDRQRRGGLRDGALARAVNEPEQPNLHVQQNNPPQQLQRFENRRRVDRNGFDRYLGEHDLLLQQMAQNIPIEGPANLPIRPGHGQMDPMLLNMQQQAARLQQEAQNQQVPEFRPFQQLEQFQQQIEQHNEQLRLMQQRAMESLRNGHPLPFFNRGGERPLPIPLHRAQAQQGQPPAPQPVPAPIPGPVPQQVPMAQGQYPNLMAPPLNQDQLQAFLLGMRPPDRNNNQREQ